MSVQPILVPTLSTFEDHLLTVAEVSDLFRCDPETVKRRARSGKLPGFKFGKFWYFRKCDIDRMISHAVESRTAIGAAPVEE